MQRERFLVKSFGDNADGAREGLIKIIQLLQEHGDAVIVVPQLGKVKDMMLVDILGEGLSKALIKNREVTFSGNKKLSLCAQSTLKNYKYASAYLALWGQEETIREIEALPQWKAVVLVTWLPQDSASWEKTNSVTTIYDDKHG